MTESHNNNVSEKYNRYILGVCYKDILYYTVWGADANTEQDDDKVLVNADGKMLLFTDINTLLEYIKQHIDELYDKERFAHWATEISKPFSTYTVKYMDKLISLQQNMRDEQDVETLVNCIHLLSDYAYQVDDQELISLYESESILGFFDAYMDEYFWQEANDHKFYDLFLKAQPAFVAMYKRFEECVSIKIK